MAPSLGLGTFRSIWAATSFDMVVQSARQYLVRNTDVWKKLGDYGPIKAANMPRDIVRTLLADGALAGRQRLRNLHEYQEHFTLNVGDRVQNLRQNPGLARTEEDAALVAEYERTESFVLVAEAKFLFFTPQLQLGMAAHAAQVGDVIAILHGSRTPCVLRKAEGGGDEGNEYRVISQCYLNGWMYGETPREVYGQGSDQNRNPHPHGRWWEEESDDFVLV